MSITQRCCGKWALFLEATRGQKRGSNVNVHHFDPENIGKVGRGVYIIKIQLEADGIQRRIQDIEIPSLLLALILRNG